MREYGDGNQIRGVHGATRAGIRPQGRLFVADRSNNRVQIFDKDMNFVDEWRHFGRPSGIAILKNDTLIVADSESSQTIGGPPTAPEGDGNAGAKSRLANGDSNRQRQGRIVPVFHPRHAPGKVMALT